MDYMTLKEASEKWGVSTRQINYFCTDGRIHGAVKMAGVWLIPKKAEFLRKSFRGIVVCARSFHGTRTTAHGRPKQ